MNGSYIRYIYFIYIFDVFENESSYFEFRISFYHENYSKNVFIVVVVFMLPVVILLKFKYKRFQIGFK